MLLLVDVGNTNIVIGLSQSGKLQHSWRVQTSRNRTSDELGLLFSLLIQSIHVPIEEIENVAIACVVPPMIRAFKEMSINYFHKNPFFIEPGIKTGMPILYDNPKEVGADRIVNSVAACREYGAPIVVVDFGTATTFDVISSKSEYIGGVIAPGIKISSEALFQHAARLPRVEIVDPKCVIGKNTIASMQSGLFYGYIGLVNEIAGRIVTELEQECSFIGTGGLVELIAPFSKYQMIVDVDLTLKGITILYELNNNNDDE